jgi:hypothetical protein
LVQHPDHADEALVTPPGASSGAASDCRPWPFASRTLSIRKNRLAATAARRRHHHTVPTDPRYRIEINRREQRASWALVLPPASGRLRADDGMFDQGREWPITSGRLYQHSSYSLMQAQIVAKLRELVL